MDRVRIGILSAARIVAPAIIRPACSVPEVDVTAIAARDPRRAQAYAKRHGIPRVHAYYEDVVADPEIDAIYVPLPQYTSQQRRAQRVQEGSGLAREIGARCCGEGQAGGAFLCGVMRETTTQLPLDSQSGQFAQDISPELSTAAVNCVLKPAKLFG